MSDLLRILAVFGLVAGNAFFVIGEYAVVTARRGALAARAAAGSSRARAAPKLMDDPARVYSTWQAGTTTLATWSNANAATGFVQKSFDLSAFAGQSVTLKFTGTEDSSLQTGFVIDDAAVNVS